MEMENAPIKGRYQPGRLIGCGGMGNVYLGTDILTGERVAIKQLRLEQTGRMPHMVERFLREGEALRRLNHPNIVKVLATAQAGSQHYIIMEYVGGGSLDDLLVREPRQPLARVVSLGLELSDALSRAHHLHILHRDIKPGNILLADDGTPRLTDFGLARIGQLAPLTESRSILGTLAYLSPEALEGREVDERSDLWALGVVLFEMLAGRLPFRGDVPFDLIWAIKNQPLPAPENLRAEMPTALASLLGRMLRKDNPARIDSARQVGAELEAIWRALPPGGEETACPAPEHCLDPMPEQAPAIRVLIADDHAVVRQGLRMFIDLQADMQVVAEAANGSEAIDLAEQLRPDLVLLDLVMPQIDGVEAAGRIKTLCPDSRIIILTSFGEQDRVLPALRAGAQGYLLKDIRPDALIQALREAHQGRTQLHPDIAQTLLAMVTGSQPAAEVPAADLPPEDDPPDS